MADTALDGEGLADFLRGRRASLQPEDVGLRRGMRRRTIGLRREEVAELCDMSADYLARLERGSGSEPSQQMAAAIARGLRLTPVSAGFESRNWYEPSSYTGTKITFTGCSGSNTVVNVTLYKVVNNLPDTNYVKAAFTKCFTGTSATSTGNWSDHGAGDYYFVVNDGGGGNVSVRSLTVTY